MYRLRLVKNGFSHESKFHRNFKLQIHSKKHGSGFEGNYEQIKDQAVSWNISLADFEYALLELINEQYDYAEFGVLGKFLYCIDESKERAC